MTNERNTVLYTGVRNDLVRRVYEHRQGLGSRFAAKYQLTKLVGYEIFKDSCNAITREKQIKAGSRRKKIALIEAANPSWRDLYDAL